MAEKVGSIYYDVTLETGKVIDGTRVIERETEKAAKAFNAITAAIKLMAAAAALVKAINLADEMRLLASRVEVAAGSMERGAEAMKALEAISRRTQTSIEANAAVFSRLNQSILQMGGAQSDTLQVTELLGKAIKVSGASAVEAKAAMLQFGQALGSGKLAGDELRSLLENAPYLMRQLADSIGVPIGSLKQLGEDGKLTSDVVVNALTQAAARINADFEKFPQTFANAFQLMEDAAARANETLDTLVGTSAVATGAMQGLAQVLDSLAQQFGNAATEQDKLGRNQIIREWADKTVVAFSYVADVVDTTWQAISVFGRNVVFTFETLGDTAAAYAAVSARLIQGDIEGAKEIGRAYRAASEERRKALDAKDANTLSGRLLAGQRMRQAMEALAMTPGADRLDLAARGAGKGSRLKPTGGADTGTEKPKFDAIGYLLSLEEKSAEAYARIDAAEREAMHKAEELQKSGKITRAQLEQAKTLIFAAASSDRQKLAEREEEEGIRVMERGYKEREAIARKAEEEAKRAAEERSKGQDFARGIIVGADQLSQLQAELEEKSAMLARFAEQDQANAELYAQARVALEQQTQQRMREVIEQQQEKKRGDDQKVLQNYGSLFGSMADIVKAFGGEQSKAYRAIFAVSKAFAVAEAIMNIQAALAKAANQPFPANLAAMGTVASATAGIIATIKGVQFGGGRQYGGPVSAGTLYRVNEGVPEMFTAANGAQYMLPKQGGNVSPTGGGGASPEWKVIVNNAPAGTTASVDQTARIVEISVGRATAEIASQIGSNSGPVWSAMTSATNVRGRF